VLIAGPFRPRSAGTLRTATRIVSVLALSLRAGAFAAEPPAGTEIIHPVDGAIMVYVPAGEFVMGLDQPEAEKVAKHLGKKDAAELWAWDCYPRHKVRLPGYFIDRFEAPVERWQRFVKATGYEGSSREVTRHFDQPEKAVLPAGDIKWEEAKKYAVWSGKALPTDAQWEKAARGTDGRLYPWGNEPPTTELGHFGPKGVQPKLYTWVGRYPKGASPYGCMDLLGNQYEWSADWMKPYPGNPQAEKMADYAGTNVSVRGGSWYHGWIGFYAAKRTGFLPTETYYHISFRTVWTPPNGYFGSADFDNAKAAVPASKEAMAKKVKLAEAAEKTPVEP